jgi:hypothetical protein
MELVQGREWAWGQRLQQVLALMRLLDQDLRLPLVRVRPGVPGLVQVPTLPSGMEQVMARLTGPATKASGLKMVQAMERQTNLKTYQF